MADSRDPNFGVNFKGDTGWIPAGGSSNVHSFRRVNNDLRVRFLDSQKTGPGPYYTYKGAGYLLGEMRAAGSKGKFVHDVLKPQFNAYGPTYGD